MPTKAVIGALIACVVAWLLAVVTWPNESRSAYAAPEALDGVPIEVDVAAVRKIVARVGAVALEAERVGDRWTVDDDARGTWAGDSAAIRSTIRDLTGAVYREAPEPETPAFRVEMETAAGNVFDLALSDRVAGGYVGGVLTTRGGSVGVLAPAALIETLESASRGGWRSTALLPRIEPGPSTLRVVSGEQQLELQRVRGRWRLAGSTARVNSNAVDALVAKLQSLNASGWLEEVEGESVADVTLETTRPDGESWVQRLEIVGQADLSGELVSVRATREHAGATTSAGAAILGTGIEGIPTVPGPLLERTSLSALPSDVRRVEVGQRIAVRDGSSWRDAEGVLLAPTAVSRLTTLLDVLTTRAGDIVDRPAEIGSKTLVFVIGDDRPRELTLFAGPGRITVWDGATARAYPAEAVWGLE
ncbi:MAG: hypothetical protein AAGI53_08990 [Planctomycetota bacterium]